MTTMDDEYRERDDPAGLSRDSHGADVGYGRDPIEDAVGSGRLFWQRLAGVLRCSPAAFAEFAGDRRATWQVAALVVVAGVIGQFGTDLAGLYSTLGELGQESQVPAMKALFVPLGFLSFAVWAGIVMLVSKLFSSESISYGGWFRALGPITATDLLQLIPFAGWLLSTLYWIVLTFVAIRTVARVSSMATIGILVGPYVVLGLLSALFFAIWTTFP